MKRKDLTGEKFGKLTVESMIYGEVSGGKARTQCMCKCDCGNVTTVVMDKLTGGRKTSCGCDTRERRRKSNRIDLTGKKFNRLTITKMLWQYHPTKVECVCDCGNTHIAAAADIVSGHTKSCGCLWRESISDANTKDWTGIVSPYGVEFISQSHKNEHGQWLWNCKCNECGSYFIALPARIMSGVTTSCGCRIRSAREELIGKILDAHEQIYIEQYRFPDCKDKYTLPFDFAIMQGDNPCLLIEYDGKQHYTSVPHFGGDVGFANRRKRDNIKNDYCKNEKIPLLRLPYNLTDDEIEQKILNAIYP